MSETLLKTPLHALHLELGARMVPFAGYDMPVQYPLGVLKEHLHTREQAGLFDVSHMGQIILRGADAAKALESLVPVDIIDLPVLPDLAALTRRRAMAANVRWAREHLGPWMGRRLRGTSSGDSLTAKYPQLTGLHTTGRV